MGIDIDKPWFEFCFAWVLGLIWLVINVGCWLADIIDPIKYGAAHAKPGTPRPTGKNPGRPYSIGRLGESFDPSRS